MIDPRVTAICEEVGVEVIESTAYPQLGQTRAHRTIRRIIQRHGEAHTRLVLQTLAETANNKAALDQVGLWVASDLVRHFSAEIEKDASHWFDIWDRLPVGYLQSRAQELRTHQRYALFGMLYERLRRVYGQPDLLEE